MTVKPNLFIVGQPKSGTSALFSFLKQLPEVCACDVKEPQFFCKDLQSQHFYLSETPRDLQHYLKLFSDMGKPYVMEGSTAYLYSEVAAEEIYRFNPEAKIIIMLREPVDFLYTYHKQLLRNSCKFEVEEDFMTALDLEDSRKRGKGLPRGVFDEKFLMYSDRVKYVDHIKRFCRYFEKDQIKVVIYDDFKKGNKEVFLDVLEFLSLGGVSLPEFGVVNKQVTVRNRVFKQFVDKYFYFVKAWLKKYIGKAVFKTLRGMYRRIVFSNKAILVLDGGLRAELKGRYIEEVKKLSDFLDRDLVTLWGYSECEVRASVEPVSRVEKVSSIS